MHIVPPTPQQFSKLESKEIGLRALLQLALFFSVVGGAVSLYLAYTNTWAIVGVFFCLISTVVSAMYFKKVSKRISKETFEKVRKSEGGQGPVIH